MHAVDDATRGRLQAEWERRRLEGYVTAPVLLEEGLALLALVDALRAAEAQAQADADRTQVLLIEWRVRATGAERWAKACQERADTAAAAQAQAAPVLAAADAWETKCLVMLGPVEVRLREAVIAWRAAREG